MDDEAEVAHMRNEELRREVYNLRRLLVVTWVADGKTRAQVEAFCEALLLPADERVELLAEFDARRPKAADIKAVRERTGLGMYDAQRLLAAFVGDVEAACGANGKRHD